MLTRGGRLARLLAGGRSIELKSGSALTAALMSSKTGIGVVVHRKFDPAMAYGGHCRAGMHTCGRQVRFEDVFPKVWPFTIRFGGVNTSWPLLPDHIRAAILTLVDSAKGEGR